MCLLSIGKQRYLQLSPTCNEVISIALHNITRQFKIEALCHPEVDDCVTFHFRYALL